MKTSVLLLVLLSASCASAQRFNHDPANPTPVIQHDADVARAQTAKSQTQVYPPQSADLTRLREDANELASLAQSIPLAVDQTTKGILPQDLDQKLKRIEKLSRQLRSRISR
jgi:hypothetical protein